MKRVRYTGRERPIRCEGVTTIAVVIGPAWVCARCGAVVRQVYLGSGRTDLDGVHDSMFRGSPERALDAVTSGTAIPA